MPNNIVSISPTGTILGSYLSIYPLSFMGQENNGTILAYYEPDWMTDVEPFGMAGFSEDLQRTWNESGVQRSNDLNESVGSKPYNFSHSQDDRGNAFTTLNAFNSSDGSLLFKTEFHGNFTGAPFVNQDVVYIVRPGRSGQWTRTGGRTAQTIPNEQGCWVRMSTVCFSVMASRSS